MKIRTTASLFVLFFVPGAVMTGCRKSDSVSAAPSRLKHEHKAPHQGTAVVLGNETYHLEFVREAESGRLQAYILDGEMENFIRANMPSFDVVVTLNGVPQTLTLKAVPNSATGETIGDTSLFEGQGDWLKMTKEFDAVVKSITIRGSTFSDVKFNFPKGNEK